MQKMVQRARKNQKGFTLVELMVTVVIIGILVVIAVPLFNGVQQNARDKAHQANLRTIDGTISMFLAENPAEAPTATNLVSEGYLQEWPTPPQPNEDDATSYAVSDAEPYRAVSVTGTPVVVE